MYTEEESFNRSKSNRLLPDTYTPKDYKTIRDDKLATKEKKRKEALIEFGTWSP